ncbi:MAG TPA: hypothetical protein PLA50_11965 [Bacteroidia bacterium]|nr:hypothetical protein [Bacteroidia bacterium]
MQTGFHQGMALGRRMLLALGCLLAAAGASAQTVVLELGSRAVPFETLAAPRNRDVLVISLHSNEATCRQVARELLPKLGGRYVALDAGGDRRLHLRPGKDQVTIDPNRMFTPQGVQIDLKKGAIARNGDVESILRFGDSVVRTFLPGARVVVAVHNNTNGGYSIKSYQSSGSEAGAARQIHVSSAHDPDNFFITTHESDYAALVALGYNVVHQSASPPDDGSLSVFAARNGIRYVNVEAEHGAKKIQAQMLTDLFRILEGR